jgi:hypothetical protein
VRKKSLSNSYLTLAVAGVGFVLPSMANAQDASPYEIRISGGLEASSNPFLLEQGTEAVSAYVAIDPTIFLEDGKDTTVIDGSLRATQYFNEYGTDANGSLRLATQRALSERTELELSASITSTRRSFVDGLTSGSSNLPFADPTALPDPVSLDPTLIGELVRSNTMSVTGSIQHELSPVSSLTGRGAFSRQSFSNNAGVDVSSASASLAYGRQVASQTVVSIGGQFASFDFAGSDVGDARVYTLQARVEHEIGTRWSLAVGGGVDLVDRNLGVLGRETSTFFSGDLGLCNRGLRTRFCVTGQRAAQPAAIGGVAIVTSVGVSYELELSRNDVLSFNSQFGRSNQTLDNGFATAGTVVDVFGASANFSHNLSERAAFIVALGYSDVSDDLRDVPANAFVRVGITLGFGRRR